MRLVVATLLLASTAASVAFASLQAASGSEDSGVIHLRVNCSAASGLNTLSSARDQIRAMPRPLTAPIVVHVSGRCEALKANGNSTAATATLLNLHGAQDSGDITWVADRASGGAALFGGLALDPSEWSVTTAEEWLAVSGAALPSVPNTTLLHIAVDFASLGVDGFGQIVNGGFGYCGQTLSELFVNGRPMTLARFPNAPLEAGEPWMDWLRVGSTGAVPEDAPWCDNAVEDTKTPDSPLHGTRRACISHSHRRRQLHGDGLSLPPNSFTQKTELDELRAKVWASTPADRWARAWLHGFWTYDWADNYIRVANVSVSGRTAVFTYDAATPPAYGVTSGARYYVVNFAAELDAVGEYFIDTANGRLYFLADASLDPRRGAANDVQLSALSSPIIALYNVQNVTVSGFDVAYIRGPSAISITGSLTRNVRLMGLTASNVGVSALAVEVGVGQSSGVAVGISDFTSLYAGCRAVSLNGGDPTTLTPAGITFTRGRLLRYSRWMRTYNPGVAFSGVGVVVNDTEIGYAPHNGLLGSGNNHFFSNNSLHDLCYEVRDSGAFYIGRSWVNRGMVLLRNVFTRIKTREPTALGANSVQAMYFDDQQSGVTAIENVCIDSNACFMVGGGRDNAVIGNKCINLTSSCILFDNRGMTWQLAMCSNATNKGQGMLVQQLEQVHYQEPPYATDYPGLNTTMQQRPCVPVGNAFINNTCSACAGFVMDQSPATVASWGSYYEGNSEP